MWQEALQWFTDDRIEAIMRAASLMAMGFVLAWLVSTGLRRALRGRSPLQQQHTVVARIIFFAILGVFGLGALLELGFSPGALLGTAGLVTVAVSFAFQTAASNMVCGVFLLVERSFQIGDLLRVGDVTGTVVSIDLSLIHI